MKHTAILSTLLIAILPLSSHAADRPNILWITSEDNSISWVSCYGSKSAKPPNIDRLASEGFRLKSEPMRAQEQFLMGIFEKTLKQPERFPEWTAKRRRQFQTLVHPEHLGRQFQVLQQVRD